MLSASRVSASRDVTWIDPVSSITISPEATHQRWRRVVHMTNGPMDWESVPLTFDSALNRAYSPPGPVFYSLVLVTNVTSIPSSLCTTPLPSKCTRRETGILQLYSSSYRALDRSTNCPSAPTSASAPAAPYFMELPIYRKDVQPRIPPLSAPVTKDGRIHRRDRHKPIL